MHSVIQKCRQASGSLPKASKVREKVPGPGPVPRLASQRRSQTPRTRTLAFESANSSTCGDDRPSAARTSSQGRTPVHGRRRAREHPSSSHAHGNGAQARAKSTARMGGAPEGGGPPQGRDPARAVPEGSRRIRPAPTRRRSWARLAPAWNSQEHVPQVGMAGSGSSLHTHRMQVFGIPLKSSRSPLSESLRNTLSTRSAT